MFASLFVAGWECALLSLEASNVIGMRLEMLAKGDNRAFQEAELMVSEKLEALTQASADLIAGVSSSVIRANYRAVIQANEVRLRVAQNAMIPSTMKSHWAS
jgi:hypothetical protein